MFDTARFFDTQFEAVEGGYRYHPWPWSKGYLVTEEEFQVTRAEYLSVSGWRFFGLMFAYLIGISVVWTFVGLSLGKAADENDWIVYLLIAPIILFAFWRIYAPQRLVWGREPYAPRRTAREQDENAAAEFGWSLIAFTIVCAGLWMALGLYLIANSNWWGLAVIALGLVGFYRTWRTIQFKLKSP